MNSLPMYDNVTTTEKIARTVRTLYDYDARQTNELGFRKGEILEILESNEDNCVDDDWLLSRSRDSGKVGYVPKNYVTDDDEALETKGRCPNAGGKVTYKNLEHLTDSREARIVRALYDYEPQHESDIGFRKGDRMRALDSDKNSDMEEWLWAVHLGNRKSGYIPKNYVVTEDSIELEESRWWFDGNRKEAEQVLLSSNEPRGTFLIRNSAERNEFVLSVLDLKDKTGDAMVRHYRVRIDEESRTLAIHRKRSFQDLIELVEHYQQTGDGLCCILGKACSRISLR